MLIVVKAHFSISLQNFDGLITERRIKAVTVDVYVMRCLQELRLLSARYWIKTFAYFMYRTVDSNEQPN